MVPLTKDKVSKLVEKHTEFLHNISERTEIFSENLGVFPKIQVRLVSKRLPNLDIVVGNTIFTISQEPGGFFCDSVQQRDADTLQTIFTSLAAASVLAGNYSSAEYSAPVLKGSVFCMLDKEVRSQYTVMCIRGQRQNTVIDVLVNGELKDKVLHKLINSPIPKLMDYYKKIPASIKAPAMDSISKNNVTLAKGILRSFDHEDLAFAKFVQEALDMEVNLNLEKWQEEGLYHFASRIKLDLAKA